MLPLRILHVVPYYEHAWAYGGIPRVATTLTRGLARRGHHVVVCTTDARDDIGRATTTATAVAGPGRLDVHVFPNVSNTLAFHWQIFTPLGFARVVRSVLGRIDIAHLHACRNWPVAAAARALAAAGVPYVLSPHGTAPLLERRFLAKRLFDATIGRGCLDRASRLVAVSQAERRQLEALDLPGARIDVLGNPVDEREFDPPPDGARFRAAHELGDAPVVLLMAKLTPRKGATTLLRAFSRIARPDARLLIAGSDMGAALPGAVTSVDPRVRYLGLLTGRDRLDALAAANVVAYPARDEVFGLVPIEALLAGSPVIVSNDSGAGEVIGTIGGGHIVPPDDEASLAGAIESMLAANGLWRQRARAAAARARRQFGSDLVVERLETLYHDVLGHSAAQDRRTA